MADTEREPLRNIAELETIDEGLYAKPCLGSPFMCEDTKAYALNRLRSPSTQPVPRPATAGTARGLYHRTQASQVLTRMLPAPQGLDTPVLSELKLLPFVNYLPVPGSSKSQWSFTMPSQIRKSLPPDIFTRTQLCASAE